MTTDQPPEPCKQHAYALCQSGLRKYVACLICGHPKPPEPCYFFTAGEQDRVDKSVRQTT